MILCAEKQAKTSRIMTIFEGIGSSNFFLNAYTLCLGAFSRSNATGTFLSKYIVSRDNGMSLFQANFRYTINIIRTSSKKKTPSLLS
jgi:hypothetical protein